MKWKKVGDRLRHNVFHYRQLARLPSASGMPARLPQSDSAVSLPSHLIRHVGRCPFVTEHAKSTCGSVLAVHMPKDSVAPDQSRRPLLLFGNSIPAEIW